MINWQNGGTSPGYSADALRGFNANGVAVAHVLSFASDPHLTAIVGEKIAYCLTVDDAKRWCEEQCEESGLTARSSEALKRAAVLVPLLTVGQVFAAGTEAIEAAGLDPWCMNEGLADKDSTLGRQWWLKED